MVGANTGRVHHLLSDIERGAFLIYDARDIREQFPLDLDQTRSIAKAAGIRHPVDSKSRADLVQTTDLVMDLEHDGKIVTIARTVKPSDALGIPRTIEKLEIERRYWAAKGIEWGIVTERELPPNLLRNLELLQGCASLDDLNQPFEGYYRERAGLIASELEAWPDPTLQAFCHAMDTRMGLNPGGALLLVRHLLAVKVWRVDMAQPIIESMPMRALPHANDSRMAIMTDPILPEYAGNPFIAHLPPPMSLQGALAALTDLQAYSPDERHYPAHLRCHCIQRLARYFDPANRHLALEGRIGALIRQGYVGSNPNIADFIHRLHNNRERVIRCDLDAGVYPVETTASGFTLIGCSGIGKSRSIDGILRLYPQTIAHDDPMALVQVSWLKLDCPHKASAKQL